MTDEAPAVRRVAACRFCGGALAIALCDLGEQPLANAFVGPASAALPDPRFPLRVRVCADCRLAQLTDIVDAGRIFSDYPYFTSFSATARDHAASLARAASERLRLGRRSNVVEIGSNDGYLLRHFVAAGIPCLGIEPAANVAAAAAAAGVPTAAAFFTASLAGGLVAERGHADLVVANNVLAHVPDINGFVAGLARLAGPRGTIAIEVPHLVRLIADVQFDTIYHEHYSYFSLVALETILARHGLAVVDVEPLPAIHGGSLRIWAAAAARQAPTGAGVAAVRGEEAGLGVAGSGYYAGFAARVAAVVAGFRSYLADARRAGRKVAAYGAAAKGNTFLNACGATAGDIVAVADRNPVKQGRLLPGSRVPVVAPAELIALRPDDVVILAWNLAGEVMAEMAAVRAWGGRFVTAIPSLRIVA